MPPRGRKESQTHDGRNRPQYSVLSLEDRTTSGEDDPSTSAEEAVLYQKGGTLYNRQKSSGTIDSYPLQTAISAEIDSDVAAESAVLSAEIVTGDATEAAARSAEIAKIKGLILNFGFTVAESTGTIVITFTQGDNSTVCSAAAPAKFNFSELQAALLLSTAKTLTIAAADDFELDTYAANKEVILFLYVIDDGGTLKFGVSRRGDYTRSNTTDFVVTSAATARNDVLVDTAIAASNHFCYVIGWFKATYDTTAQDWASVTAETDVVGPPPGPHPDMVVKAWGSFDVTTTAMGINDSRNISGITDGGAGVITIDLDSDMPDTNYALVAAAGTKAAGTDRFASIRTKSTTQVGFHTRDDAGAALDTDELSFAILGS